MLNIVWLPRLDCKRSFWSGFDASHETWVVSDVKSKIFLTENLLDRAGLVSGRPVKRASELWIEMLRAVSPAFKTVGVPASKTMAREFLNEHGSSLWCQRPRAPERLVDACRTFASFVAHPLAEETLGDFGEKFGDSQKLISETLKLAIDFYEQCIQTKVLPWFFVPAFLQQQGSSLSSGRFYFDLGFELTPSERDLIQKLAETSDVFVLAPGTKEGLQNTPYGSLYFGAADTKELTPELPQNLPKSPDLLLCSSPFSESREAVARISQWVSEGISPKSICICSSEIGLYEDHLDKELQWEGIGFARKRTAPFSSIAPVRALSSRLQIAAGKLDRASIEEAEYHSWDLACHASRANVRRLLKPVKDSFHISSKPIRSKVIEWQTIQVDKSIGIQEFEEIVFQFSRDLILNGDLMENLGRTLLSLRRELGHLSISFRSWVSAWLETARAFEIIIAKSAPEGVIGVDLASAEDSPASALLILGSRNPPLKPSIGSQMNGQAIKFFQDAGFDFLTRDFSDLQTQWLLTGEWKQIVLSTPKGDASGKAVTPSRTWLKQAKEAKRDLENLSSPRDTAWVRAQKNILNPDVAARMDRWYGRCENETLKRGFIVNAELKSTPLVEIGDAGPFPYSISASKLEEYWKCPFRFYASHVLRLSREPDVDFEPAPQTKGLWLHQAAERIFNSGVPLSEWDTEKLTTLTDELGTSYREVVPDLWNSVRARLVRQLDRFLRFERKWQEEHPRAKPKAFEARLSGFLNWSSEERSFSFSQQASPEKFSARFSGSVDRIDELNSGEYFLLDYKSNEQARHIDRWKNQGTFQLALYTAALEAGLADNSARSVAGAHFYSLRKLERNKGFRLDNVAWQGVIPENRQKGRDLISTSEKEEMFGAIAEEIHSCLEGIRSRRFTPAPRKEETCETCSWRRQCRAHHLL